MDRRLIVISAAGLSLAACNAAPPPPNSVVAAVAAGGFVRPEPASSASDSAEKAAYIARNVELYAFQARYYADYADKQVPGVDFKLRNKGDRTLTRVKVRVVFKDASGNPIAEDDFVPVSESSFSGGSPLRPGYIWQQERGMFYTAKSVPDEWAEGKAEARVVDVDFAHSPAE